MIEEFFSPIFPTASYMLIIYYSAENVSILVHKMSETQGNSPKTQRDSIQNNKGERNAANPHTWKAETSECLAFLLDE